MAAPKLPNVADKRRAEGTSAIGGLGVTAPKRCTAREKCQGADTRYDTVSSGVYSLTLKCRVCGFIVRHDWD